jgi:adenylate cyclase
MLRNLLADRLRPVNGLASDHEARREVAAQVEAQLNWVGFLSNGIGALIVFVYFVFLTPGRFNDSELHDIAVRNGIAFAIFLPPSLALGRWWAGRKPFEPIREWLRSGRPATDAERRMVLRYPAVWAWRTSLFWAGAGLLFAALNVSLGVVSMAGIAFTVLLGAITSCSLQYLMVERVMRPVTVVALAGSRPDRLETPGVAVRLTMAWAAASGIALLGIVVFSLGDLLGSGIDHTQTIAASLFLAVLGLAVGAAAIMLASRSLGHSLAGVRGGLDRIERREFETRVEIDDGSEIGLLQAGFNRMAAGLAEREQIRETFGAYVDPEIAEHILEEGPDLGGEAVEATILFVDIRDFTSWSERASPGEVVKTLNRLFEGIVPIIHEHGGHVDKFVGDGLMAVFGAPRRQEDHADQAFAAACEIAALVAKEFEPELRVGIGLNSGTVVAGNVGGAGRLDFSVIGDPVNVAARVEAATRETGDTILLTADTKDRLERSTVALEERPTVPLKGKLTPVALYAPADAVTSPS